MAKSGKIISGQNGLARAAGVSQAAVSQWLKDRDWKWGRGPWKSSDLAAILEFGRGRRRRSNDPAESAKAGGAGAGAELGGNPRKRAKAIADLGPLERASLQLKLESAASKKVDREITLGKYVLREDVEKERVGRIHAVKNASLALVESGIVELIRGAESELDGKEIMRGRIHEMLQAFAGGKY